MYEHNYQCPFCWETNTILLDTSVKKQTYIEDCEICCNPLEFKVVFKNEELVDFKVTPADR